VRNKFYVETKFRKTKNKKCGERNKRSEEKVMWREIYTKKRRRTWEI